MYNLLQNVCSYIEKKYLSNSYNTIFFTNLIVSLTRATSPVMEFYSIFQFKFG